MKKSTNWQRRQRLQLIAELDQQLAEMSTIRNLAMLQQCGDVERHAVHVMRRMRRLIRKVERRLKQTNSNR